MENILTVDVEDWVSSISGIFGKFLPSREDVYKNTLELLEIFEKYNTKGTFFFLGETAEKFPLLLKDVLNSGHSIGCHSYNHIEINKFSLNEIKEQIKKAKDIIEQIIGNKIIGFRSPNFSLMKAPYEVLDLLLETGFKYDSSIFPYKKYNGKKIALSPFWLETPKKNKIFEIPLTIYNFFGLKIPCCGGAFFRIYPYFLTKYFIKKINKENKMIVFYIHPHEFEDIDFQNINIKISGFRRFLEKKGRKKVKDYLNKILKDYKFNSIENIYSKELKVLNIFS